jgi:adenylyltransferase/sulfurtransferase
LGVLPGIIGSMQASEVIKVITGVGDPLVGRLFTYDALNFETRILRFKKDKHNPISGENITIRELIDYEQFCGIVKQPTHSETQKLNTVKELTVQELKQLIDSKADFQLIDVREDYEFEIANLNGELIPLGTVLQHVDKISKDKQVVVHCRSGKRSADAIRVLEERFGFDNLYNLKGGILAYADQIDNSLAKY